MMVVVVSGVDRLMQRGSVCVVGEVQLANHEGMLGCGDSRRDWPRRGRTADVDRDRDGFVRVICKRLLNPDCRRIAKDVRSIETRTRSMIIDHQIYHEGGGVHVHVHCMCKLTRLLFVALLSSWGNRELVSCSCVRRLSCTPSGDCNNVRDYRIASEGNIIICGLSLLGLGGSALCLAS
jgi:hypothetical protein